MILHSAVYLSVFAYQDYIGHFSNFDMLSKCYATTANFKLAHEILMAILSLFLHQCQGKYMAENLRNVSIYRFSLASIWIIIIKKIRYHDDVIFMMEIP